MEDRVMRRWAMLVTMLAAACTSAAPRAPGGTTSASASRGAKGGMMPRGGMMAGTGMMGAMAAGAPADTSAAPTARADRADSAAGCPGVTQALADRGRTLFGTTGNCHVCHGPNAAGTALAPDLTDSTWLDIDGSYAAIVKLLRSGVPAPRRC